MEQRRNTGALDLNKIETLRQLDIPGETSLVVKLAEIFFRTVPANIEGMKNALKENNYSSLKEIAHSVKSSAGNLGATKVSDLCDKIEYSEDVDLLSQGSKLLDVLGMEYHLAEIELKNICETAARH